MRLYEKLPTVLTVGRRRYRLNLDYRNVLRMLDILARNDLLPAARTWKALRCVMRRPPAKGADQALEALKAILFPAPKGGVSGERLIDYTQDADYIRAAFRQCYRIDLDTARLHWLTFQALVAGLPEGCKYMEIVGIRARPLPKPTKYNHDERENLMKAKLVYALDKTETESARDYDRGVQNVFAGLLSMAQKGG